MWHYVMDGNVQGPVSETEARQLVTNGTLTAETLVWRQGMADWQPARTCSFFTAANPGAPPPIPPLPQRASNANTPDTTLDFLAHLLGLVTGFIGPLILMLCTQQPTVKRHACEALNWQLSLILYAVISMILVFFIIGFFMMIAVLVMDFVFCIIATVKASQGVFWRYPMNIRFVRE